TPPQQLAFGRHFGTPNEYPFVEGLAEAPEVIEILKVETDAKNFGGLWHSDTSYLERPPLATLLYAREVPPAGGDTLFANTRLAYERLSGGMKAMLAGLQGVNSAALRHAGGRQGTAKGNTRMKAKNVERADDLEAVHPIVRTHPETGDKSLYLNTAHTVRFQDMTEAESTPLIDYLTDHIRRPEFTCRVRWEVDTLVVWDNRSTHHYAVNDYQGHRRRMHRVTIEGDVPH
ncbi:MAG: TauD/TfdA family dioxygenase, partial [Alphaproteobacteria bacterium]